MGSEVRFRVRRGCKVSRDAHMLVNKPKISSYNDDLNFETGEESKEDSHGISMI
jgi:hypothetical protein